LVKLKEINQKTEIVDNSEERAHFSIINENEKNISLLIIDKCLQFPTNQKKCDFAFWTDKVFYFSEIKDTANRSSKNKSNSIEQLEKTIQHFCDHLIDFGNRILYAIVVWAYHPPRPLANSTMQNYSFRFRQKYNVILQEGNKINL
jgi:hypothetical protein